MFYCLADSLGSLLLFANTFSGSSGGRQRGVWKEGKEGARLHHQVASVVGHCAGIIEAINNRRERVFSLTSTRRGTTTVAAARGGVVGGDGSSGGRAAAEGQWQTPIGCLTKVPKVTNSGQLSASSSLSSLPLTHLPHTPLPPRPFGNSLANPICACVSTVSLQLQ